MNDTRELHARKYEAQMNEWSAKLDVLKARMEKATAQARLEIQPHFEAVRSKFDDAKAKLAELKDTADDKWNAFVETLDRAWRDVEATAAGAYDAFKRHEKT